MNLQQNGSNRNYKHLPSCSLSVGPIFIFPSKTVWPIPNICLYMSNQEPLRLNATTRGTHTHTHTCTHIHTTTVLNNYGEVNVFLWSSQLWDGNVKIGPTEGLHEGRYVSLLLLPFCRSLKYIPFDETHFRSWNSIYVYLIFAPLRNSTGFVLPRSTW